MMKRLQVILSICAAATFLSVFAPVAHASFGFQSLDFSIDSAPPAGAEPGAVGPPAVQAGSHPYQVTVSFTFNQAAQPTGEPLPDGAAKDLQVELPPGLIGSVVRIPQCPAEAFENGSFFSQGCPAAAQVGTLTLDTSFFDLTVPVFNLEPPIGAAATLGVFALATPVAMDISVRTGDDYGLTVSMRNLPQFLPVFGGSLTLWGVPADDRHDTLRGSCLGIEGESTGSCASSLPRIPFLTLPGSCGVPPQAIFRTDSWQRPWEFVSGSALARDAKDEAAPLQGCDRLDFSPTLQVRPEGRVADSPSGLGISLRLPQNENPDGLAEADVRRAVLTLPPGVSINPAAADGLGVCLSREIGLDNPAEPRCPDSSRIGSVAIESPLIAGSLLGSLHLAAPHRNPFGSMLAVYLTAERGGVIVKLAGRIEADPTTGQLTVTLDRMPELPFSELELSFDGGPRAPLATPPSCGAFTTTARLIPHSASGDNEPVVSSSRFVIDRGCGGGFSPAFLAGATSALAGRHTALRLRLARADGEPALRSFAATLPPGLLPLLGSVPSCAEVQASTGTCGEASRIGSVAIAAGAGPHPFHFPGRVFLTGPYRGAPFGLSIAVPAVAGPFDLGGIVVRATVSVDPRDARVRIATDPLPRILQGIPLRIRSFDLSSADRPGLFVSPTSCKVQRVSATAVGGGGAIASLSSPFALAGCPGLRFAPLISMSTRALVTRGEGASLRVAVRNPRGAQANIGAIAIGFPRQLSPRLSAIQRACARTAFAADPASCPPASVIGRAEVRTPVLGTALRGRVYLVSRGVDALPRMVLVLQARGVTLHIVGSLHISNAGTTAATFASMPDAPISRLVLTLPRGPHSVLGASFLDEAKGSLCGRNLRASTKVLAQSGPQVRASTPISVSGCAR